VTENSVILKEGLEKSAYNIDRSAQSMWLTEFSVTYMFWSCVTLGFSSSAAELTKILLAIQGVQG
jgi:hypothetical protein